MHSLKPILGWSTSQFYWSSLINTAHRDLAIFTRSSLQALRIYQSGRASPVKAPSDQPTDVQLHSAGPFYNFHLFLVAACYSWVGWIFWGCLCSWNLSSFPKEAWKLSLIYTTVHESHHRDRGCRCRWRTAQLLPPSFTVAPQDDAQCCFWAGHTYFFTKKGFSCASLNLITQTYEGILTRFLLISFFMWRNSDILPRLCRHLLPFDLQKQLWHPSEYWFLLTDGKRF